VSYTLVTDDTVHRQHSAIFGSRCCLCGSNKGTKLLVLNPRRHVTVFNAAWKCDECTGIGAQREYYYTPRARGKR
jgi:hypothetical protein